MQTCTRCGLRAPVLPVRIDVVRESGPIGRPGDPAPGQDPAFTRRYVFCGVEHLYEWLREHRMMICNRQQTPFEEGMQPYLPSRHLGGRIGLCDGHHLGAHEWKEAWPG
jgi:hypothetical protein